MVQIKAVSGNLQILPAVVHSIETIHCEGDDVVITVSIPDEIKNTHTEVAVFDYQGERAVIESKNEFLRELLADRIATYMTDGRRGEIRIMEALRQVWFKLKRKFIKSGLFRKAYYGTTLRESDEASRFLSFLVASNDEFIAVLAPHPDDPTLSPREGYIKRVKAIDDALFNTQKKIYLYDSEYWKTDEIRLEYRGRDSFYIIYNTTYASHRTFVQNVIQQCSIMYIHSALRIMALNFSEPFLDPFISGKKILFDMHGALPEETEQTGTPEQAHIAAKAEKLCVTNASVIISVTESLTRHVHDKYNISTRAVIVPIFIPDKLIDAEKPEGKQVVIYSGGTQTWQCIDEMVQSINFCPADLIYRLCLTDLSELQNFTMVKGREVSAVSLGTKELIEEYKRASFGFLLREDTTLNRVACPTKLIEYLNYGIVPILNSTNIGDFGEAGLAYVAIEDFLAGKLPTVTERRDMAAHNRVILEHMTEIRKEGIETLRQFLPRRKG